MQQQRFRCGLEPFNVSLCLGRSETHLVQMAPTAVSPARRRTGSGPNPSWRRTRSPMEHLDLQISQKLVGGMKHSARGPTNHPQAPPRTDWPPTAASWQPPHRPPGEDRRWVSPASSTTSPPGQRRCERHLALASRVGCRPWGLLPSVQTTKVGPMFCRQSLQQDSKVLEVELRDSWLKGALARCGFFELQKGDELEVYLEGLV